MKVIFSNSFLILIQANFVLPVESAEGYFNNGVHFAPGSLQGDEAARWVAQLNQEGKAALLILPPQALSVSSGPPHHSLQTQVPQHTLASQHSPHVGHAAVPYSPHVAPAAVPFQSTVPMQQYVSGPGLGPPMQAWGSQVIPPQNLWVGPAAQQVWSAPSFPRQPTAPHMPPPHSYQPGNPYQLSGFPQQFAYRS